jgi:hypothetical protein
MIFLSLQEELIRLLTLDDKGRPSSVVDGTAFLKKEFKVEVEVDDVLGRLVFIFGSKICKRRLSKVETDEK